jgi:4-amino-4-deoxy-L-arabinose transferase-like glycosyltransferase
MTANPEGRRSASPVAPPPASQPTPRLRRVAYGALIAILILFAVVRLRLRTMPLERDEGEYAYAGQLMLEGIPPYKLAYNMKLPGTYAAYAVIMTLFGQTTSGIRLGMLLINSVTTIFVFLLGRRLYGILAATVASATYALLSNRTSMLALDGHATHFVVLAAVAATLLLLRALHNGRTITLFGSGLLYGLAFLMKQPGILFAAFAIFYWAWSQRRREAGWRKLIWQGSAFAAGFFLPFALTCLLLLRAGVFRQFCFWTFSYGTQYASLLSFSQGWKLFTGILPWILRPFVISGIAAFGLTSIIWDSRARKEGVFLLAFLLFSFLAVCPGLYFRGHYFLVMLPAIAVLTGVGIAAARERLIEHRVTILPAWLPVVFFALTFLTALYGHRKFLFQMNPAQVDKRMHPEDGFVEATTVADYVGGHSLRQDSLAILGSEPEIYFYARRHSATGYIYMFGLMENQKFARQMQNDMIQQIEDSRPSLVVYVDNEHSWGWSIPGGEKKDLFDWMRRYFEAGYSLAEKIPIASNPPHQWGDQACFYIFQRKDR